MEHCMAVTRTVSVGAIGSCARLRGKPDALDFSTERRHSSAGLRALLWATSGARSLGSFSGSEGHSSKENVFTNILTPDSIPRFTIPSLSVQPVGQQAEDGGRKPGEGGAGEREEGAGLEAAMCSLSVPPSSGSSSSSSASYPGRLAHRSVSDPLTLGRRAVRRGSSVPYLEDQHCPDPASRAALSLPHLEKVTTPYGFVTLSRSPQMASEEALLCLRRPQAWEESSDRPQRPGGMPQTSPTASRTPALANPRPSLTPASRTPALANPRPSLTPASSTPAHTNPRPSLTPASRTPALANPRPSLTPASRTPALANPRPSLTPASSTPAHTNPRPSLTPASSTPAHTNPRPSLTPASRTPALTNPRPAPRRTSHAPHLSKDVTSSHAGEVPKKKMLRRTTSTAWSLPSSSSSGEKPTRRLWGVIRKHFTSQ